MWFELPGTNKRGGMVLGAVGPSEHLRLDVIRHNGGQIRFGSPNVDQTHSSIGQFFPRLHRHFLDIVE